MHPTRFSIALGVIAAVLVAVPSAAAQTEAQTQESRQPVVVVTGEGIVKAVPDQAFVTIGAEHRSGDPTTAQAQTAKAMNAVQEQLAALGIPKEAVRTVGINLQLEADYVDGKRVPRGYVATNTIEVRVDDLARLGDVIDTSIATGATTMHGLRFDVKDRNALEQQALREAVVDGRARAEAAAAGAGAAVDRILRVEETGARVFQPQPTMMRMAAEDARSTPIAAGEIEIRAQVTLTAALK